MRAGLSFEKIAPLVGISKYTLYKSSSSLRAEAVIEVADESNYGDVYAYPGENIGFGLRCRVCNREEMAGIGGKMATVCP